MIERPVDPKDLEKILPFLPTTDLCKHLSMEALQDFIASMKILSIGGGETLIRQGSEDSTLYILYQGRLRVSIQDPNNPGRPVDQADISPGEVAGEIAFLIQSPRTATVKAIRDSIVLKLDQKTFARFEQNHPEEVIQIAKTALRRIVKKQRPTQLGENISTIAVMPAGQSNHIPLARLLARELNPIKPTHSIDKEMCNQHFGREIADTQLGHPDSELISEWLLSLEQGSFIVFETDREMTPWTERCLRHSDRFLLTADVSLAPDKNPIEERIFSQGDFDSWKELVFLHSSPRTGEGTGRWLDSRPVNNYHHVHLESGLARLCRFLTSRAFGVVLSGGGSRGFAHAGILKALDELGVQVDFIGGTSMGAVISGGYAKFGADHTIELCRQKNIIDIRRDYTFPFVSLLKGKTVTQYLKKWAESTCIEDLWTRFFCISTNVTTRSQHVHEKGPLWLALRASTSIPGLYPPVYDEEGNMLVDGGLINNLPVDVMRKMLGGGKILAIDCRILGKMEPKHVVSDVWTSGWKLLFQRLNPFSKKTDEKSTILDILHTSFGLSSLEKELRMAKEADYLLEMDLNEYSLLDFPRSGDLVDAGYRYAIEKLPKILGLKKSTDS